MQTPSPKKFLRNNGLTLVLLAMFLFALVGQALTGHTVHNEELARAGGETLSFLSYLRSSHFISATFENWESEFLQMAVFVVLTVSLRQRGSSESKEPDEDDY